MTGTVYDLAVIGGGINGAGIAADAAGRGLSVILFEKGDLGSGTSSASSKLIHGGLRYLENFEFGLVRESLAEREVLLRKAPHLIWPLRFVIPAGASSRSQLMLRAGLFLYDHLAPRVTLQGSQSVDLRSDPAGRLLSPALSRGLSYWDCWADDARLVVANAMQAAQLGARVLTRTKVHAVIRQDSKWILHLNGNAGQFTVAATGVVNAAGPWAADVARLRDSETARQSVRVRLVKGSHIVIGRKLGTDAYLLQNDDGRIVFALPYEHNFTLIGTTDVAIDGDPGDVCVSDDEIDYLCKVASRYLAQRVERHDIVWSFAGVRPLFEDGTGNPSKVSRDYKIEVASEEPPWLDVIGGKLTTYRRLAEDVLEKLGRYFDDLLPGWTRHATLPGGEVGSAGFEIFVLELQKRYPGIAPDYLRLLARRYGVLADAVLDGARDQTALGRQFGPKLTEREVFYLARKEWAVTPDDVLWRRTKAGLHMSPTERERASDMIAQLI